MKNSPGPIFINCLVLLMSFYLFSVYGCRSNTEEIVQNYPTGEISRRHTEINGKKEGVMTEYYKDGKVKGERMFKDDLQMGKTVFYYPGGEIKEVLYFEDGKIQGGDTIFYENGQPKFLRNFNKGKMDGYIRKWGTDGSVIYEAKYKNDTLVEVKGEQVRRDTTVHN